MGGADGRSAAHALGLEAGAHSPMSLRRPRCYSVLLTTQHGFREGRRCPGQETSNKDMTCAKTTCLSCEHVNRAKHRACACLGPNL